MKKRRSNSRSKILDFSLLHSDQFREIIMFTAVVLLVVFVMIFYVWERIEIYKTVYQINKLKNTVSELSKANKALEVKYYKLSNYHRIEKIAKAHLGLVDSEQAQVIIVEDSRMGKDKEQLKIAEPVHATYDERRSLISRILELSRAYAEARR